MLKIEYSPASLKDLEELHHYIVPNWGDRVAKEIIKKIISDIRSLEQFPLLGAALEKKIDIPTDYRYLFSEKNFIFYRLCSDNIRIIRVINERQDYMKHLFDENVD